MIARGALKSPWMAQNYKRRILQESSMERTLRIKLFFREYRSQLESEHISERGLLKQTKSVSRFMFEGIDNGEVIRRKILISQTVPEIYNILENL
jgi:tRNA-dihydrouridine synthase